MKQNVNTTIPERDQKSGGKLKLFWHVILELKAAQATSSSWWNINIYLIWHIF